MIPIVGPDLTLVVAQTLVCLATMFMATFGVVAAAR